MHGNLFLDPMVTETDQLMNILQIDFLQPIYTFTFSNGLIACLIFMGIGTMLDINFVLAKPLQSMFLALCAELGTFAVLPIAYSMGLSPSDSASIAMVGGADRADGAFHLAQPLEGDLRADHRRLPISISA